MKVFFNQLFDYNFHCNKQLIETCISMQNVPVKSKELFNHILNAHHRWNAVMTTKKPEYDLFQVHEVGDWGDIHYEKPKKFL